ncbi:MAG: hypothetical protein BGO49_27930 [Planctomycetales bacterium 71-10]|nr:MAG: hypothetical protein BGO49_27930 [Planctomycetales bacterium 71-10]
MPKPPSIPSRTVVAALLALLAFATVPSAVGAGCFHPLGPTPPGAASLDHLSDLGALAGEPSPPPPSPCDGLRCSNDPAPGPAPTIPTVDRADRWGCLATTAVADPLATPHPVPPRASLRPSHGGPAPFHPPRA